MKNKIKFSHAKTRKNAAKKVVFDDDEEQSEEEVSKSQLKREMHYLQDLGTQLLNIKHSDLLGLSLSEQLLTTLAETKRIKHREGLRRQMQFVGKLMRKEDAETIAGVENYFEQLNNRHQIHNQKQHLVEQWRDRILQDSKEIETFMQSYPSADRKWLRQIARQSALETEHNKPPASARKLFVYIRDLLADST